MLLVQTAPQLSAGGPDQMFAQQHFTQEAALSGKTCRDQISAEAVMLEPLCPGGLQR